MKEYNGYRSWNAWNVALWLYNEEYLYRIVQEEIDESKKRGRSLTKTAQAILRQLPPRTPDGAKYNELAIKLAIQEDFDYKS